MAYPTEEVEGDRPLGLRELCEQLDTKVTAWRRAVVRWLLIGLVTAAAGACLGYALVWFVDWAAGDVCRGSQHPRCAGLR